jgi:hypothetical protein
MKDLKYFRIEDDFPSAGRWYLRSPRTAADVEVDPRSFTEGRFYSGERPLLVPLRRQGPSLDFTLGAFDMPIVTTEIAAFLQQFAPDGVQRVPVKIDGHDGNYETVNILSLAKAINEELSEISWWTEEDNNPAKTGTYAGIGKLVLNREKLSGHHILRLKDWELPFIVSEEIKKQLELLGATGVTYKELQIV